MPVLFAEWCSHAVGVNVVASVDDDIYSIPTYNLVSSNWSHPLSTGSASLSMRILI